MSRKILQTTMQTREEIFLQNLFPFIMNRELPSIRIVETPDEDLDKGLGNYTGKDTAVYKLRGVQEAKAIKAKFFDSDLETAKRCWHVCGCLDLYYTKVLGYSGILGMGFGYITYALLSDNSKLIHQYATLSTAAFESGKKMALGSELFTSAVQSLILDDISGLEADLRLIRDKALKGRDSKLMELDYKIYQAIAARDFDQTQSLLRELVSPKINKKRRGGDAISEDFIAVPAIGYAKIGWMKGLQVDVGSPLVAQELLPIQPLDHYDEPYDFLRSFLQSLQPNSGQV